MTPSPSIGPLPSPPRQVVGGPGAAVWIGRVMVLPHTLVGLAMLAGCLALVLQSFFSVPVTAKVVEGFTSTGKSGQQHWQVSTEYLVSGEPEQTSVAVSEAEYHQLVDDQGKAVEGAELPLRRFGVGPLELADRPGKDTWLGLLAFMVPFALLWNGVMAIAYRQLWWVPRRRRRLVAEGTQAQGTIVKQWTARSRNGRSYRVRLSYLDAEAQPHEVEDVARDEAAWKTAPEGAAVTVLFDPEKPKHALAYELCEYQVDPSAVQPL